MTLTAFSPPPPGADYDDLRQEVRAFLADELADFPPIKRAQSWNGFSRDFSRKLAQRGWVGMTFPKEYGGHARSALGPLILAKGTDDQKRRIVPRIAAGELCFCIGMSEPDSGSDLAATRTMATEVDGGFRINGTKVWTTYAHVADYMILFCRTGKSDDRHGGMSQFLVDLKATDNIQITPIIDLGGEHHFNQVVFDDTFLPSDALLGEKGEGWSQVMSELAFERSGPERFLSSFALIEELIRLLRDDATEAQQAEIGRLSAHLMVLRQMSRSVAGMLNEGENPSLQAAIVKDLGALFEQDIPRLARSLVSRPAVPGGSDSYAAVLAYTELAVPSFSLRGGTREILRGIIARGLGLR